MFATGFAIFLGLVFIFIKLGRRTMLRMLGHDVWLGDGAVILPGYDPALPESVAALLRDGRDALAEADVVVTDRLGPVAAIAEHAPHAEVVHVGKIPRGPFTPQERINEILVEHARAGKVVVRLKGGDGFVLGRGGEEWLDLVGVNYYFNNQWIHGGKPVDVDDAVAMLTVLAGRTHQVLTAVVVACAVAACLSADALLRGRGVSAP